jgi:hypothetical protein
MLARPHLDPALVVGHAPAMSSALSLVAAVLAVRRGEGRSVLITSAGGRSASCALVLTTPEARDGS